MLNKIYYINNITMIDIDGKYIPGFDTPFHYEGGPKKKYKKDYRYIITWDDITKYEWKYIPDEYLPAWELVKL